jgi:hypothetical protein
VSEENERPGRKKRAWGLLGFFVGLALAGGLYQGLGLDERLGLKDAPPPVTPLPTPR